MQVQTVFKAGNSSVVTLPKSLGFQPGDKVLVDRGMSNGTAFIAKSNGKYKASSITPEFLRILDGINRRYGKALAELARR